MLPRRSTFLFACAALLASARAQHVGFLSVDDVPDGDGPIDLAYTPDGQLLLVLHQQSDDLTFLDPNTGEVVAVVPVGTDPLDLAVTPDGARALTADRGSGTVTVVDVATRSVSATIPLSGERPYQVEVTSDGGRAVVCLAGPTYADGSVSVIDLASLSEESSFPTAAQEDHWLYMPAAGQGELGVQAEFFPRFDVTTDDARVLIPSAGSVHVYDLASGIEVAAFLEIDQPIAIRVNDDGLSAVVVTEFAGSVNYAWRIDLEDLTASFVTAFPALFYGDAIEFLSSDVVAVGTWDTLSIIDLVTGSLSSSYILDGLVFDFELTRDGEYLIVTNSPEFDGVTTTTMVVELATQSVVATLPGGGRRLARDPTSDRAAALELRLEERLHRLDIAGASSQLVGSGPTGAPVEGDTPARMDVAEQARILVTANTVSRNVAVLDIDSGEVEQWIPTLGRPLDIVVTPDGAHAVAATTLGLELIDIEQGAATDLVPGVQVHLDLLPRPGGAEVWAVSEKAITGHLIVGDALEPIVSHPIPERPSSAYAFSKSGVLALSLVQNGPQSRQLIVYDAVNRSERTLLDLAAWELELAHDGSELYIRGQGELLQMRLDRGAPEIIASLPVGGVLEPTLGGDGRYLYIHAPGDALHIIDVETFSIAATVSVEDAWDIDAVGPWLFTSSASAWRRYRADGAHLELVDTVELDERPNHPAFSERLGAIFDPKPGKRDGVQFVDYTPPIPRYCSPAQPSSTGEPAWITADGFLCAGDAMALVARDLPANKTGYFLVSRNESLVLFPGGSEGTLCLGAPRGRFRSQAQNSGPDGALDILAQTSRLPQPGGAVGVLAGETWRFQAWFRDLNPGPTSNFTDAIRVTFR